MLFSVVVPVYQNEGNLHKTIPTLLNLFNDDSDINIELVFVNDGSTDGSYKILKEYYQNYSDKIKIINFTRNFGQIPAIRAGLREATGVCVGVISADLQDPPCLFKEMINIWKQGTAKLVIAERKDREEKGIGKLFSGLYWLLVNKLALKDYPVGGFDFCLIDRQIVAEVNKLYEKNTHIFPLIFSLGFSYEVLFYKREKRQKGKSQWSFIKKLKLFLDTFIAFSYFPVRIISLTGITIAILAFLYSLYALFLYFAYGNKYPGWTTLALLTSLMGGLVLSTLGILGEYLWRILDEVRKRPDYVIDKIYASTKDKK